MKNRNLNSLIIDMIVGIILILYIIFLYLDFYNIKFFINSYYIKYLCVLFCFLLCLRINKNSFTDIFNHRDIFLLQLAMLITVISDFCLVIFDFYILGVFLFSLVQITYSVRFSNKKPKTILIRFSIIFLCIVVLYSVAILFIAGINVLFPISLFYFICLLMSVSSAIVVWKNNSYTFFSKYMIVFGMILFLLCDICVALSNILLLLPFTGYDLEGVQQISSFLIWVFYLPSQLLLSLSGNGKIQ